MDLLRLPRDPRVVKQWVYPGTSHGLLPHVIAKADEHTAEEARASDNAGAHSNDEERAETFAHAFPITLRSQKEHETDNDEGDDGDCATDAHQKFFDLAEKAVYFVHDGEPF